MGGRVRPVFRDHTIPRILEVMKITRWIAPLATFALAFGCETPPAQATRDQPLAQVQDRALFQRMLATEDARAATDEQIAPLREGLAHTDPMIRRVAVRAIGRFERVALIREILPLLEDVDPAVRAEAANALGQAARGGDTGFARNGLQARFANETDPRVRGVIAETLGRLPHGTAAEVEATASTISAIATNGGEESVAAHLGAARGFFFLTRQQAGRESLPAPSLAALRSLLVYDEAESRAGNSEQARRIRTVAAAALFATGRAVPQDYETAAADADPLVRREAASALLAFQDPSRDALISRLLEDPSPAVRYDALRVHTRVSRSACPAIAAAIADEGPHVRLLAIDAATQCAGTGIETTLDSLARALPAANTAWHNAAHALASLAVLAPDRARSHLNAFASHSNFFVRAWAAVAATRLQDDGTLRRLTSDAHPNVRTAAITGLSELRGHSADSILIAQLSSDDSQLVQTAAAALAGSTNPAALDALVQSLDVFSSRARETERDARMALLERIAELGGPAHVASLEPRLTDFDPAVAARTAEIIGAWTGTPGNIAPTAPTSPALPTLEELEDLAGRHVLIVMETGDTIEISLRPFDAPTNTARFARLAREGYFNGLTFHRVAPNFVIQGGSRNANEYAGDGPFSRDELTIDANWRGTVGLSTRGRDTGDAQIYINLIDNVRLDHDYTVFGEIVGGMDAVGRVLEGAIMTSVTVQ